MFTHEIMNSNTNIARVCTLFCQMEVLLNTWPVFDRFRGSFLIGEMIWNFADFQTDESKFHTPSHISTAYTYIVRGCVREV